MVRVGYGLLLVERLGLGVRNGYCLGCRLGYDNGLVYVLGYSLVLVYRLR